VPDVVAPQVPVATPRGATEGKEGKAREGSDANERTSIPKETQLMASRNVSQQSLQLRVAAVINIWQQDWHLGV